MTLDSCVWRQFQTYKGLYSSNEKANVTHNFRPSWWILVILDCAGPSFPQSLGRICPNSNMKQITLWSQVVSVVENFRITLQKFMQMKRTVDYKVFLHHLSLNLQDDFSINKYIRIIFFIYICRDIQNAVPNSSPKWKSHTCMLV